MKITPWKQKGLKAVSDSRGVIAAAAMDQRGSLRSAIAKEKGMDKKEVTSQMLEEFKTAVTRVLTPHASAILLDPEYVAAQNNLGNALTDAGRFEEAVAAYQEALRLAPDSAQIFGNLACALQASGPAEAGLSSWAVFGAPARR